MFGFLSDMYCFLIGWIITPDSCSSEFGKVGSYKSDAILTGGKHKKTRKHIKGKKNKISLHRHK